MLMSCTYLDAFPCQKHLEPGSMSVGQLLDACTSLVAPIDAFFEKVCISMLIGYEHLPFFVLIPFF